VLFLTEGGGIVLKFSYQNQPQKRLQAYRGICSILSNNYTYTMQIIFLSRRQKRLSVFRAEFFGPHN
jgi:hypothetical protein